MRNEKAGGAQPPACKIPRWVWLRLVGGLGRELVLRHGRDGLGSFLVPAQDEARNDDPKGEQSDEGGTGGDSNHFNLSPS